MRSARLFDLMVVLFIVASGLATAYVCFGVLSSQANGRFEQYSLGGAIVGAVVSWSLLTTIYLRVRKASEDLDDLRRQNQELQGKLIRGAPRPDGFVIEVDERQRVVLARPQDWEPKGGIIFQLEMPGKPEDKDSFAGSFRCSFLPIDKNKDSKQTAEQYYNYQLQQLEAEAKSGYVQSYSKEFARLGGEAASAESLKVIARQFARVKKLRDPGSLRAQRVWEIIPSTEFFGWIYDCTPRQVVVGHPTSIALRGNGFHKKAVCRVNKKSREAKFVGPGVVEVTLELEDVANPGYLELAIENPETNGRWSNLAWITVIEAPHDRPAGPEAPAGDGGQQVAHEMPAAENPKEAPAMTPAEGRGKKSATSAESPQAGEPDEAFLEIVSMTVICYQEALEKIFFFEFWDDSRDFLESSDEFNRVLASARFLN